MSFFDSSSSTPSSNSTPSSSIPVPESDLAINRPPQKQHERVVGFVREAPAARYTFDSRLNREEPSCELCRVEPEGGLSCIKLAMHSAALFKSMQSMGFYCALPAEPTRTDMECSYIPR
ncbi:hypothetical protein BD324DRAFT_638468 [Kockovaella imperatae]|uniref:Uncharacterized protein n=1 Tax=Kockovaella imperatae TaxID=4999 RepID=A0A1Y1U6W8_9TREE|nr:hypothetical protein BD324DRAFT_638468 [Kockovaella imperatae]ORX33758.1 hypothetical protein BD324DRAFT_638468 [Kockovaella imperatae]